LCPCGSGCWDENRKGKVKEVFYFIDSDGIIKMTKSGAMIKVANNFECFISDKVYNEAVIEGKSRLYEDAFQIEDLIKKGKLSVIKTKKNVKSENILRNWRHIGEGERSTLHLFFNIRANVIVSDDQAFLNLLYRNNIAFIIPSDLIVKLFKLKILDKEESLSALKRIKDYIRESNYLKAKEKVT